MSTSSIRLDQDLIEKAAIMAKAEKLGYSYEDGTVILELLASHPIFNHLLNFVRLFKMI